MTYYGEQARAYDRARYKKNPRRRAQLVTYYWRNRVIRIKKMKERYAKVREEDKLRKTLAHRLMREAAAGRPKPETCELCDKMGKIVYDHCHDSEKFRGWLCDHCNRTLGAIEKDIDLTMKMVAYIVKHKVKAIIERKG